MRFTSAGSRTLRSAAVAVLATFTLWAVPVSAQSTCAGFAEVKTAIDDVLDKDAAKGAEFRKQFKEGTDPFTIMEQLLDAEVNKKIDICRFDVANYFTKRGFPPAH
jgi:hypothetical protein